MDEDDNRYIPRNMPAFGDLMQMFASSIATTMVTTIATARS
jgi:hypothetical protein